MKRINTSPTPELVEAVRRYANDNGVSISFAMTKLAAIGVKQVYGKSVEPTKPHGDVSRIERMPTLMKCGWCGHQQLVPTWQEECLNCGECEFTDIKTK